MSCLVYADKETLPSEKGTPYRLTRRSKLLNVFYIACAYGILLPAVVHIFGSSVTLPSAAATWGGVFILTTVSLIKYNSVAVTRKERRELLFWVVLQATLLILLAILLTHKVA